MSTRNRRSVVSENGPLPIRVLRRSSCVGYSVPFLLPPRTTWRLSTEQLERLHACLMSFSSMDPTEVAAYVRGAIAGTIKPT